MKKISILIFVAVFALQDCTYAQTKENYDVIDYTAPKGWSKTQKPYGVSFSKESGNDFCMITIYKSIDAGTNAQTNFDMAWQSLVQENLGVSVKAVMQPGSTDNGWETKIGSAPFDKDGIKGAAILISSSQNSKLVNIVSLTNSNIFEKEMETFLASIDLKTAMVVNKTTTNKVKLEMWVNWRASQKNMLAPKITSNIKTNIDFYAIYPNGDYFPEVPWQGLTNFNKSYNAASWGKFTMSGIKGKFKSKYQDIDVKKLSDTKMEQTGLYSYGFYKCLPVDGLRIEGAYNVVSENWGKDPQLNYLDGPGCQYVIHFKKDGTFEDKGIFYTGVMPGLGNCSGGKGSYTIENFTISFKYNDGRIVERLFTLPGTRNPANYDEAIYLGETPYYKKIKK